MKGISTSARTASVDQRPVPLTAWLAGFFLARGGTKFRGIVSVCIGNLSIRGRLLSKGIIMPEAPKPS